MIEGFMLTQSYFIFGCEDIIQIDFWNCGSHHIKNIAGDLGSRICQLVEGIIEVLFDDLILDRNNDLLVDTSNLVLDPGQNI